MYVPWSSVALIGASLLADLRAKAIELSLNGDVVSRYEPGWVYTLCEPQYPMARTDDGKVESAVVGLCPPPGEGARRKSSLTLMVGRKDAPC